MVGPQHDMPNQTSDFRLYTPSWQAPPPPGVVLEQLCGAHGGVFVVAGVLLRPLLQGKVRIRLNFFKTSFSGSRLHLRPEYSGGTP